MGKGKVQISDPLPHDGAGSASSPGASPLSPELMQRMMADIDAMRTSDPDGFQKLLMSITKDAMGEGGAAGQPGSGGIDAAALTPEALQAQLFARLMQEAFLRSQEGGENPLNLPDGRTAMGTNGIEAKMPGKYITPTAEFVIKTKTTSADTSKIFINVCTNEELGEPGLKKRLDENGEEVEGMNIPMSVGPKRMSNDKTDTPCAVYDVIVNPKVVLDATTDKSGKQKDFLCQLAIQSLEQKYKLELDYRYKLPKLKVFGELQQQYIQDRKKIPKIEEVASKKNTAAEKAKAPAAPKTISQDLLKMPWKISWCLDPNAATTSDAPEWDYPSGDYVEPIVIPDAYIKSIKYIAELENVTEDQVDLKVSPFLMKLSVKGYHTVSQYFPCAIIPSSCSWTLQTPPGAIKKRLLEIHFPIDRSEWDVAPDAGSKPWLIAQAMDTDDGTTSDANIYRNLVSRQQQAAQEAQEDVFHVRLSKDPPRQPKPKNVSTFEDSDDEELPEDRFHKNDAMSSYLLQQRKDEKREKHMKYEKEREERQNDPNVEYVDIEQFKPGGKYGDKPKSDASGEGSGTATVIEPSPLQQAASVILSALPSEPAPEVGPVPAVNLGSLKSKLWTELL